MNLRFKGKRKNITHLQSPVKIENDRKAGIRVSILVNLSNYENIRIESSEYDDVEKCFRELEDALDRINTYETKAFISSYLSNRNYKDKLGAFKKSHPNY